MYNQLLKKMTQGKRRSSGKSLSLPNFGQMGVEQVLPLLDRAELRLCGKKRKSGEGNVACFGDVARRVNSIALCIE